MTESVFTYGAPGLKFGEGASDEIGYDLSQYDVRRVLVVTDPGVAATGHPQRVADQMAQFGIEASVYDGVHVEPTDASMEAAIAHARDTGPWDAFVAVGGGSSIDTAKAVNLLTTNDGELMDYINAPVGKARAPEEPAQAARRGADHHRHRRGVDHDLRARRTRPEGEDRHQPPAAAPDARRRRPGADADPARRRHLGGGDGHPVPRAGELHRAAVHLLRAQAARAAGAVLRLQPDLRHVVGEGDVPARAGVPAGRAPRRRHRRAARDGAGGDVRRARLRQRRRAHPARQRLPDRRPGEGLPAPRATRRTSRWCRTAWRSR